MFFKTLGFHTPMQSFRELHYYSAHQKQFFVPKKEPRLVAGICRGVDPLTELKRYQRPFAMAIGEVGIKKDRERGRKQKEREGRKGREGKGKLRTNESFQKWAPVTVRHLGFDRKRVLTTLQPPETCTTPAYQHFSIIGQRTAELLMI